MIPPAAPSPDERRREAVRQYPELWKRMVAEWASEDARDSMWLLYSANYLLRTGAARWALDPLTLRWRVPETASVPARRDLSALSFVVLTHRHADHLDLDLLRSLRSLPIPWIVPEALREHVVGVGRLAGSQVIAASHGRPIELDGIRLTPFPGFHFERADSRPAPNAPHSVRGVPATGYLVEWGTKRWLFPGDTRDYRTGAQPDYGVVSGLIAHVWLGHGTAHLTAPPLLDAQAEFCLRSQPRRVVLTHLEEFGRPASDLWTLRHSALLMERLTAMDHEVIVEAARTGDRVLL